VKTGDGAGGVVDAGRRLDNRGRGEMKTIFLFRHGKSDQEAGTDVDHERPLTKRGRKAAALMGRYLAALEEIPDEAHASTAARAAETLRIAAEAGRWKCPVAESPLLYQATTESALEFIRGLDDAKERVLLVGHEPAWSQLLAALVGGGRVQLPTAAMARVDFPAEEWAKVQTGTGTLAWLTTPKRLDRIGWRG
jgi:phosphohistidine phosphatase